MCDGTLYDIWCMISCKVYMLYDIWSISYDIFGYICAVYCMKNTIICKIHSYIIQYTSYIISSYMYVQCITRGVIGGLGFTILETMKRVSQVAAAASEAGNPVSGTRGSIAIRVCEKFSVLLEKKNRRFFFFQFFVVWYFENIFSVRLVYALWSALVCSRMHPLTCVWGRASSCVGGRETSLRFFKN